VEQWVLPIAIGTMVYRSPNNYTSHAKSFAGNVCLCRITSAQYLLLYTSAYGRGWKRISFLPLANADGDSQLYLNRMMMAPKAVNTKIIFLKNASSIIFTSLIPNTNPRIIPGINFISSRRVSFEMVFQIKK
jgi:hypothetical protein